MNRCMMGWPMLGLAIVLIFGCGSSQNSDYMVLFDEPVMIFDETVYNNGVPIGTVAETEIGPGNRSKIRVKLDSKSGSLLTQNNVFILKSGRLCLTTVAPFGAPLETDAMLPGFASKLDFNLFRLKHIFADKVIAARSRTEKLARWQ